MGLISINIILKTLILENELQENIMVDWFYGNSNKIYQNQPIILKYIIDKSIIKLSPIIELN